MTVRLSRSGRRNRADPAPYGWLSLVDEWTCVVFLTLGMHPVYTFERRGRSDVRVGMMTGRQRGAGPAASGYGRIPGATGGPEDKLRRRLGCADLTAVSEVRCALRELLRHWRGKPDTPDTADVAELLASELVTNALVHTDHGAVVTATVEAATLRVEVRDFVAGLPTPRVPTADLGTNGRGLVLVQSLADAWGVRTHGVGKAVWFELHGLHGPHEGPA